MIPIKQSAAGENQWQAKIGEGVRVRSLMCPSERVYSRGSESARSEMSPWRGVCAVVGRRKTTAQKLMPRIASQYDTSQLVDTSRGREVAAQKHGERRIDRE